MLAVPSPKKIKDFPSSALINHDTRNLADSAFKARLFVDEKLWMKCSVDLYIVRMNHRSIVVLTRTHRSFCAESEAYLRQAAY